MTESADWWGAMNEQMRKYAGARNLPTKVADENDIPAVQAAPVSSTSNSQQDVRPSADIPKRPAASNAPVPQPLANNTSKPVATAPLPARSSPQQSQQHAPQQQQIPTKAAATVAPLVPDYAISDISPETNQISKLSLAEQMELKMQAKIAGSPAANVLEIPQFDAVPMDSHPIPKPAGSGNPWDTFEGDNNPGW